MRVFLLCSFHLMIPVFTLFHFDFTVLQESAAMTRVISFSFLNLNWYVSSRSVVLLLMIIQMSSFVPSPDRLCGSSAPSDDVPGKASVS